MLFFVMVSRAVEQWQTQIPVMLMSCVEIFWPERRLRPVGRLLPLGFLQDWSLLYWSELLGGGNVFHWLNNFKPCNTKVNVFPFNGQRHSTGFILFSLLSTMCVHLVVLFHLLDLNRTDFEASNHSLTWPRIQCCVKIKTYKLFCAILHPSFSFFYFLPIPDCLGDTQHCLHTTLKEVFW